MSALNAEEFITDLPKNVEDVKYDIEKRKWKRTMTFKKFSRSSCKRVPTPMEKEVVTDSEKCRKWTCIETYWIKYYLVWEKVESKEIGISYILKNEQLADI